MKKEVKTKEKLIFAAGDMFGGGAQAIISVMYLLFLMDIIGLQPATATAIVMISKIWDAVTDPLMGAVSDNTRTKLGRRRPYILAGGILVFVAFALLWFPVAFQSTAGRVAYVLGTYLFYNTVSTVVMVPYSSMSAEITTVEKERNTTNVLRLVFSTTATAICTLVPSLIFEMLKSGKITVTGLYLIIGIGFGAFFSIALVLVGVFTKEREKIPTQKGKFEVRNFVKPLKVRAFRQLLGMYILQSLCMDILSSGIVLFAKYVVGGSSTVFLGIFIGVQLSMFPVLNKLVNKIDKNKIYYFGLPLSIISMALLCSYPADWETVGAYVITVFVALGFAGAQLTSWIIFPHAVDAGELQFGERNTGSFSGLMTFSRKFCSALAIFIFGVVLEMTGYQTPERPDQLLPQPESALLGIRAAMGITFIIFMIAAFFIGYRCVLTQKNCRKVKEYLELQRDGKLNSLTGKDKEELEGFKKKMI